MSFLLPFLGSVKSAQTQKKFDLEGAGGLKLNKKSKKVAFVFLAKL